MSHAAETDLDAVGWDRRLSPTWQILLIGTAPSLTAVEGQRLQRLVATASVDWTPLVARACVHGVAPLLFRTLRRQGLADHVPAAARAILASVFYRNAARSTLLGRLVRQVVAALQAQGIRVIALKGAALAETVYPEPAVRPMSDIDLLVRPEAVEAAEAVLRELGYTRSARTRHPPDWWRTQHYHLTWHPPASAPLAVPVELHWQLERPSRPFAIDLEGLWGRAMPARLAGVDTWVLAPEDLLLHLCLHLCKHASRPYPGARRDLRLRAFCDLAFVLHQHAATLDWQALGHRAQAWGIASYLAVPLQLTGALWGMSMPSSILDSWGANAVDPRLVGWLRDELLEDPDHSLLLPRVLRLWRGQGVDGRMAVLHHLLAPNVVAERYGMPPTEFRRYGYYPIRLWQLGRCYGPVLWRLLRHDPPTLAEAERKVQLGTWLQPFTTSAPATRPPASPQPSAESSSAARTVQSRAL